MNNPTFYIRRNYWLTLVMFLIVTMGYTQSVHIAVSSVPENTPSEDLLFLAANYNEWDAANAGYRLKRSKSGTWFIDVTRKDNDTLFFKFTRGGWESVEGDALGKRRNNRVYVFKQKYDTLRLQIDSWEDIKPPATVRLLVVDNTGTTPDSAELFFTGNLNSWDPGNTRFKLQKLLVNTYAIDIPKYDDTLKYKYTRGSWAAVEGDEKGGIRNERIIIPGQRSQVYDTISTWEDIAYPRHYHLWVSELPDNTPKAAEVYVTGNFNQWDPGDPNYVMTKTDSGLMINITYAGDTLHYKFTRGDWQTVEGRANGLAIPNRVAIFNSKDNMFKSRIHSWEDLRAGGFQVYTLSLIIPVVIGLLLIFALHGVRTVQSATPILQVLIGLICVALMFRMVLYYRDLFNWYPQLIVFSDFVYFLYGPVFLLYVWKILQVNIKPGVVVYLLFLIPFALLGISYIQFFTVEYEDFVFHIVNNDFRQIFILTGGFGLLFNAYCWWLSIRFYRKTLKDSKSSFIRLTYLKTLLTYHGLILFFWMMAYLLGGIAMLFSVSLGPVINVCIDICWLLFGGIVCLFTFLAIRNPEIFKARKEELTVKSGESLVQDELKSHIRQLDRLMIIRKPYLNENLSLQDLADMLEINIHQLSRVINEGFDMNFFDYINAYRIDEFIAMVMDPCNDNKTFLALAYEAGFNSKSTFNRAFKKAKNQSPREFFKTKKVAV